MLFIGFVVLMFVGYCSGLVLYLLGLAGFLVGWLICYLDWLLVLYFVLVVLD